MQGIYKPTNPSKYKGDPANIVYRSSYELKLFSRLDGDPNVEWWQSEELIVPYRCKTDGRLHRYFPDIVMKRTDGKVFMIEIKPFHQTTEPKSTNSLTKTGKSRKAYITEVLTYAKNKSKWEAAEEYCKDRGWQFLIMTEYELGIKTR
jgi:hypothetical protein